MPLPDSTIQLINERFDDVVRGISTLNDKMSKLIADSATHTADAKAQGQRMDRTEKKLDEHHDRISDLEDAQNKVSGVLSTLGYLGGGLMTAGLGGVVLHWLGLV